MAHHLGDGRFAHRHGDLPFSDIEGSTKLLHELGAEAFAEALAEHRRVIRGACAEYGGVEVDTQGDAFFFAFPTAPGALAAAEALTDTLAPGPIRVRVGLHTGTPFLTEDGYVGDDVHRAARIAAAGHGGQVLVSASTERLVGADLRDLGEHRFKDLSAPERLFQYGDGEFPKLKSLYRSNLPIPATPFLGREHELAVVMGILGRDGVRLVTLTGPGGTGKTRLAAHAAAEMSELFPDGVFWVSLAPLRDPALMLATVAQAIEIKDDADKSTLESLVARLIGKRVLLLLDNAEHLLPEFAADVSALIAATPTLSVVVTSREILRVEGEHVYAVPTLTDEDGVSLFVARARALDPTFSRSTAIDELCEHLDHLPLALELAAARTGLLSPGQLLERLGGRLDILKGGRDADPRQQTLRATISWSYDLLSSGEQQGFARLSVFAGGCTLEAAEAVCESDLDTLQSLIDKSLVRRRDTERGPRLWMLETIREFAAEQLATAGAGDDVAQRHLDHYLGLAKDVSKNTEEAEYDLNRIEAERDNLRTALDTALATDRNRALDLAGCQGPYWSRRGHYREGRERLAAVLAAAPDAPPSARSLALHFAGGLARSQSDFDAAERLGREALELDSQRHDPQAMSRDLNLLGTVALYRGDYAEAERLLEESVAQDRLSGGGSRPSDALFHLMALAFSRNDHPRAIELAHELVAGSTRCQDSRGLAYALNLLGLSLEATGKTEGARQSFEESIAVCRSHNYPDTLAYALASQAHLDQVTRSSDAIVRYHESLGLMRELGDERGIAFCLEGLAAIAGGRDPRRAAVLLGAAAAVRERTGAALTPEERKEVEATISEAKKALEAGAFSAAWSAGTGMGLDEVVEFALSLRGPA